MKKDAKEPYELIPEELQEQITYFNEVFPKLPFPRDWSDASIIGADWKLRLMDIDHQQITDNSVNVPVVMEQFCWFVANRKPIPIDLSSYVAKAFYEYLRMNKSLETAFKIKGGGVGKKVKKDYEGHSYPIDLFHLMWEVIVNETSMHKAKLINKTKSPTLNDYLKKMRLIDDALFHLIMTIETKFYRHLSADEQERILQFKPDYKYIAFNSEETLSKIKEKDEQSTIEAKKNALKKSFNLNNDNDL
jgi:hypothetical protein